MDSGDCLSCGATLYLHGQYLLEAVLGKGADCVTYRATRRSDNALVAIKELVVHQLDGFKAAELFDREISILKQVRHEQIPRLIDSFTEGDGKGLGLYLVREHVDGSSLAEEMKTRQHGVDEIAGVAAELLDILAYLHQLAPPVLHRDVTLSNVLRRKSDDKLVLIDFGSVRDVVVTNTVGGSTISGTLGYIAPEQLVGQATPATDIYGVAAVSVALAARKPAAELVNPKGRLEARHHLPPGPFASLLGRMLAVDPKTRPSDAGQVSNEIAGLRKAGKLTYATGWQAVVHRMSSARRGVSLPAKVAFFSVVLVLLVVGAVFLRTDRQRVPAATNENLSKCERQDSCRDIGEGFENIRLDERCRTAKTIEERKRERPRKAPFSFGVKVADLKMSCWFPTRSGEVCNLYCGTYPKVPDAKEFWVKAKALVEYIDNRYGSHSASKDSRASSNQMSWTWKARRGTMPDTELVLVAEYVPRQPFPKRLLRMTYRGKLAQAEGSMQSMVSGSSETLGSR